MIKSMFSAVTGLRSHQTMMDVIGNNIANVNTAGFKASRVVFTDVFSQKLSAATSPTADGGGKNPLQIGCGANISTIDVINTRSGFMQTEKPTDLYIAGEGYLVVRDASGDVSYTRVGNLNFDAAGNLVDANGNHICGAVDDLATAGTNEGLLPAYDPAAPVALSSLKNINIDLDDYSNISICQDGTITGINSTGQIVTLSQIALATFANPDGLSQEGTLYVKPSPNSGAAIYSAPGSYVAGTLVSGGLEMSNVDLAKQFTDMIITQRGFQANSRVITTSDEILQELVSLKR